MGEFFAAFGSLGFAPFTTLALVVAALLAKAKVRQHNEMYFWYVGKLAIEKAERERLARGT